MLNDIYSVADAVLVVHGDSIRGRGIGGILGGWFTTKYSRMRDN